MHGMGKIMQLKLSSAAQIMQKFLRELKSQGELMF